MLDTGLIAAQIAFLLLLYLFVWRIVRSSSKSIDPVANRDAKKTAPPVVAPVVPAAPAPAPAQRSVPEGEPMPAVVRIPPPAASRAAPPSVAEPPPVVPIMEEPRPAEVASGSTPEGDVPPALAELAHDANADEMPPALAGADEEHPLLGAEPAPATDSPSVEHDAPEEDDPGDLWTPADDEAEASANGSELPSEEAGPTDPEVPDGPLDAAEPAVAAATGFSDTGSSRRSRADGGGVINLDNLAPKLVVEESPGLAAGFQVDLAGGLTIGRSGSSDVTVDDPFVSHMHARILRRGAYYFVEDLGSTNGTFLNDQEVERDARLKVRDTLRVGQTVLRYEE